MNMKRFIALLLVPVLGGFLFATGCRTTKNAGVAIKEGTTEAAQQVDKTTEDGSITAAVKMKFANDETVSAFKIDVDTRDGYVTLNGTVASKKEEERAIAIAHTVDGVKGVKSNLTLRQS